jgi:hypothetical protein
MEVVLVGLLVLVALVVLVSLSVGPDDPPYGY